LDNLIFSGRDGVIILGAYAIIMLVIGYMSGRKDKGLHENMSNYFLAGKNLGIIALFFTLYATQYSGNTVVGYTPAAYRVGFSWIQSIFFMTMVIAVYLLFAPRLYVISKKFNFITPADWIQHRFNSKAVTFLSIVLMIWGLGNFMLEQLVAIGLAVSGLTGGTIPYQMAVIAFILVMLIYEWMGGMKAVAFTDVMQGIVMMIGIFTFLAGALYLVGGSFSNVTSYLANAEPAKAGVPDMKTSINWISMVLLAGLGASVYPQAIQRIYSSKSERILKRSFARMAWMPPITTGVVFMVGIIGIMLFPGLDRSGSEQLVGLLANEVASINGFFYWVMILFFGAIVAAIVSTADSALLSLSSMISNDVYGRYINKNAPDKKKVFVGKVTGVVMVAILLWIAWNPPATLYQILVLKLELISQIFPAIVVGIYWKRLSAAPVFWGMFVGAITAGMLTLTGNSTIMGIHGGIIGLAANLTICVVGSYITPFTKEKSKHAEEATSINVSA
jgi:SSS family solute:Na+ symporter/sodium/pantothenate symporter